MKNYTQILLIAAACLFSINTYAGGPQTPTGKTSFATYEGTWKGTEKCKSVSAPVAIITILPKNATEVTIKGLYSTEGAVTGIFKNNSISIPSQEIKDPLFKNISITGTITISAGHNALSAVFTIINNNSRDDCMATYTK